MTQPADSPAQQTNNRFQLDNIPDDEEDQARRGWRVEINGEDVEHPIQKLHLSHKKMGLTLEYGQHPGGYDTWKFHEPGGGGAVTLPYAIIDGQLLIGVVKQNRPAAGGEMHEAPRGFMDPGETHEEAAVRETAEETGLRAIKSRFEKLGDGKNPNTTFFDTSGEDEGVSFYGLQVKPDELTKVTDEDGSTHYEFRRDIQEQAEGDGVAERITGSSFITIQEAVTSPDLMTAAGAGLLTSRLIGMRTLELTHVAVEEL